MSANLAESEKVKSTVALLSHQGCTIEGSLHSGHVTVRDGETIVYKALQKGYKQPWIVRCMESEKIKWDYAT